MHKISPGRVEQANLRACSTLPPFFCVFVRGASMAGLKRGTGYTMVCVPGT